MKRYFQHDEKACLPTAVACVLEIEPKAIYTALGKKIQDMVHLQEIIRFLMDQGEKPTLLEYKPFFVINDSVIEVKVTFWKYFKKGILMVDKEGIHHAIAVDGDMWDPSGSFVDESIEPVAGVTW